MRSKHFLFPVLAALLGIALAFAQVPNPKVYTLTEIQKLKLESKQKDVIILQQQIQALQQQYESVASRLQNSSREYQELAESIRKENKWDDAQFNIQTGQFEAKPAAAAQQVPAPAAEKKK